MASSLMKVIAVGIVGMALAGTAGEAFARARYGYGTGYNRPIGPGSYGPRRRGVNPGAIAAGAALGIAGAAIAGAAASRSYNGYPSYSYGRPGYDEDGRYGYDYHPGRGYYGPY